MRLLPFSIVAILGFFFCVFFLRGIIYLDPDFGWYMSLGRYTLQHGVPMTDQLSYTMPQYAVVDHEWLANSAVSLVYPYVGMSGLAVFFALVAVSAMGVACYMVPRNRRAYLVVPLFATGATMMNFVGVRMQVLGWFLMAVFFALSFHKAFAQKRWFLTPLLFLLWGNVHGSFAIAIVLLFLITAYRILVRDHELQKEVLTVILSCVATVINPYGIKIWYEVWMQFADQHKWSIMEWHPAITFPNGFYWALVLISLALIFRYYRRIPPLHLGVFFFLLFAGLASRRNIPLWEIFALPIITNLIFYLVQDAKRVKYGFVRLKNIYIGILVLFSIGFVFQSAFAYFAAAARSESYYFPAKAIPYLQVNERSGNIFAPYEWGGYISWKAPGRKIYISGQMPSWRGDAGNSRSQDAFAEYMALMEGKIAFNELVEKYDITALLWYNTKTIRTPFGGRAEDIVLQAKALGWDEAYRDQTAVLYLKK